jgi:long-subunit fatty acid transport protein
VQSSLANGLTAYFKDAWTYTAGIGHSFTPRLSASANLSFTQGAASGDNNPSGFIALPYTDAWTLGLGGKYKLTDNVNVKAGVFATRLKGATYLNGGVYSRATEGGRYDASWLYTSGASLTVAF